jgi:hypothetical protein
MEPTNLDAQPETPAGLAARWSAELSAAREKEKVWWDRGEAIIKRYLDDRPSKDRNSSRLNLYTSNTQTLEALLLGKTPEVDVERRFADSADDVARVAAEMLKRLLNTDLEKDGDTQTEAFRNALADRLRPGMGNVRLRYEVEMQTVKGAPATPQAPAVPDTETKSSESVDVDYVFWKDQLWSPCRTFAELRWWAFAADMDREAFKKRFPEGQFTPNTPKQDEKKQQEYLQRCRVWEIWSKEDKQVFWLVEGHAEILDQKADPLGLGGFWPFPRPMFANLTTTDLLPTPDFCLAQDLYDGIDQLETRINLLEDAIRVAGVYDQTNDGLKQILSNRAENQLYPVATWAVFSEKGGIANAIEWLPLEQIVGALDKLRECRTEKIGLLYQITGMSDIMRGQASQQTTATEQAIKARFASVRVQTLQNEFARFCSETQKIKAEIISKLFSPETVLEMSNAQYLPENDRALAEQAAQLIVSGKLDARVTVNPDSVSLTDFAALKQERFEFAQTISGYFQGMIPLVQMSAAQPAMAMPTMEFVINLGQQLVSGLKGASQMEGIFDEWVAKLKQAASAPPPPPRPDPKMQVAQIKAQAEQGKAQAGMQQTQMSMQVATAKHQMDMQKLALEQQAAQADHVRGIQSAEAKERAEAMKKMNEVTQ